MLSCTSHKYAEVPVDRVKIEYKDRISIDTLYRNDSTIIKEKGDTIFLEKYKYLYRIKEVRDTICKTDTIVAIRQVPVTKEINRLHKWQIFLMAFGGGAIVLCGYKLCRFIKI